MPHEHMDELQIEIPLLVPADVPEASKDPTKPAGPQVDFEIRANVDFWL